MAEWKTLSGVDLSSVESASGVVQDVSVGVASYLSAVASAVRTISFFVSNDVDIIRSTVDGTLSLLEEMIYDLLHNNVAAAVHVNMRWDPEWVWKKPSPNPHGWVDWATDQVLPWKGNGFDGWLLDIAASTEDPAQPLRPLTDIDTKVVGFIYVIGVPSISQDVSAIKALLRSLTDFSDFEEQLDDENLNLSDRQLGLKRAGAMAQSHFVSSFVRDPVHVGEDIKNAYTGLADDWNFFPGSFPKWVSVPMARIFPAIYKLFRRLEAVIDALRQPSNNLLSTLAELVAMRADILAALALEIGDIIQNLMDLADLLEGGYFIWLQVGPVEAGDQDSASGGMVGFITEALNADGKPDLGPEAVFGGIVGVATAENPAAAAQAFWEFLGIRGEELTASDTTRKAQIESTLEDASAHF